MPIDRTEVDRLVERKLRESFGVLRFDRVMGAVRPGQLAVPAARIRHSVNQAIASGGFGQGVAFDTVDYDPDGMKSGNSLVVPRDGIYTIAVNVEWASNTTGLRDLIVLKGLTNIGRELHDADGSGNVIQAFSFDAKLVAGDSISLTARQTSGGNLNINAQIYSPALSVRYVRNPS